MLFALICIHILITQCIRFFFIFCCTQSGMMNQLKLQIPDIPCSSLHFENLFSLTIITFVSLKSKISCIGGTLLQMLAPTA